MVRHGGSSASSYLADPTSPIPSHCASIVVTSTVKVNDTTLSLLLPCTYVTDNHSSVCLLTQSQTVKHDYIVINVCCFLEVANPFYLFTFSFITHSLTLPLAYLLTHTPAHSLTHSLTQCCFLIVLCCFPEATSPPSYCKLTGFFSPGETWQGERKSKGERNLVH